jgi:hypothetical protein
MAWDPSHRKKTKKNFVSNPTRKSHKWLHLISGRHYKNRSPAKIKSSGKLIKSNCGLCLKASFNRLENLSLTLQVHPSFHSILLRFQSTGF